ncbi:class I SAM-dependent methyltransferase [Isoptericola sp. b441]|uniref:Class I SAM-dependent methyltransferase n=1 Tax=Actinotalea lenta TaxID=3064654 RepID=A0ABT9DBF8_9CELL|nr:MULTISPECIES: class I SAM-dependent methyltransferase [unclassified Isoptericola]MDO8108213.1 class I SAM-dependent methyltransferase [Isoptericola sp. b441]MDO8120115.1 class I SAM-dependent methyltransferase [Isoptericola sp. b490]
MPHDVSWDEYNAHQWGRTPRASLGLALRAAQPPDGRRPVAVDLGCGEGIEVAELLAEGWTVHALDGERAALERLTTRSSGLPAGRLHTVHADFAALPPLPPADLVHSSYALPYCPPHAFDALWAAAVGALRPGGVLACQLFGPRDDAFGDPEMTFHTAEQVRTLLDGLEVVHWREEDADGTSYVGPRHWHVFHVVARR